MGEYIDRNKKVKREVGIQCEMNFNKQIRDLEKKLKKLKKFYFSELKAFRNKMQSLKSDNETLSEESKKQLNKIQVKQ